MNPTIEVQINAKLDRLDAGLRVAEASVGKSAATMGKTGDTAGSAFVEGITRKIQSGLLMGAITNVLGNGILTAIEGINAGKSGEDIGIDIAKGIVDGAKSIPVVGIVVSIIDELVNGATRNIERLGELVEKGVQKYITAMEKMNKATKDFVKQSKEKVEDVAVADSPEDQARLNAARQNEKAKEAAEAAKATQREATSELSKQQKLAYDKRVAEMKDEGISGDLVRSMNNEQSRDDELAAFSRKQASELERSKKAQAERTAEIEQALADQLVAIEEEKNNKLKKLADQTAKDKAAQIQATNEAQIRATKEAERVAQEQRADEIQATRDAYDTGNEMVEIFKEQERERIEIAIQAQQDIIDAENAAQAQISKVGRLDKMAGDAARAMINSGQTALGQFNFAQSGSGNMAITLAQKQVNSLEKIEAATAEQVRLQKEMAGFR